MVDKWKISGGQVEDKWWTSGGQVTYKWELGGSGGPHSESHRVSIAW